MNQIPIRVMLSSAVPFVPASIVQQDRRTHLSTNTAVLHFQPTSYFKYENNCEIWGFPGGDDCDDDPLILGTVWIGW
jgi:hypothetical protein